MEIFNYAHTLLLLLYFCEECYLSINSMLNMLGIAPNYHSVTIFVAVYTYKEYFIQDL